MTSPVIQLHNKARRYCIHRLEGLKFTQLNNQRELLGIMASTQGLGQQAIIQVIFEKIMSLTKEEYLAVEARAKAYKDDSGIRLDLLEIILQRIERLITEDITSLEALKQGLIVEIEKAKISEIRHYAGWTEAEKQTICTDEIKKIRQFIKDAQLTELTETDSLFFRRVLSAQDEARVLEKLKKAWLNRLPNPYEGNKSDIMVVASELFFQTLNQSQLVSYLQNEGETLIYELNSCEVDVTSYVMDIDQMLLRPKLQSYWCSNSMRWAILKDHEGFLFVCGKSLVDFFKAHGEQSQ